MTITPETEPADEAILTTHAPIDPLTFCDRCGKGVAFARARITTITGSELYLCGHHHDRHAAALSADVTLTVYRESDKED